MFDLTKEDANVLICALEYIGTLEGDLTPSEEEILIKLRDYVAICEKGE